MSDKRVSFKNNLPFDVKLCEYNGNSFGTCYDIQKRKSLSIVVKIGCLYIASFVFDSHLYRISNIIKIYRDTNEVSIGGSSYEEGSKNTKTPHRSLSSVSIENNLQLPVFIAKNNTIIMYLNPFEEKLFYGLEKQGINTGEIYQVLIGFDGKRILSYDISIPSEFTTKISLFKNQS